MPSNRTGLILLLILWTLLSACGATATPEPMTPSPTATPTETAPALTSTTTVLPSPTITLTQSRTPRATLTPKPSPTLPDVVIMACLPADGSRVSGIVAGVIDGDTIVVQVGLISWTVRYLGVYTPETNVEPPERFGLEAKTRNRELVTGRRVILVSDPEAGETDIYDRLLRYVIVDDIFVNYQLVREGLAHYYASEFSCGPTIFQAEREARSDNIGLWGP